MKAWTTAFLPLLAVACAATPSETTSSDEAASTAEDLCATLDYGPRPAPEEMFHIFSSNVEAAQYMSAFDTSGTLARMAGPDARFGRIAEGDRVERLTRDVFEGFKVAFPREMAGLDTAPPVAIVNTPIVNAFAFSPGLRFAGYDFGNRAPWLFVVYSGMLEKGKTDNELRGIFAHELGHLILRTPVREVRMRVRSAYYFDGANETGVFGATKDHVQAVDDRARAMWMLQQRIGPVANLGFPALRSGSYVKALSKMITPGSMTEGCIAGRQSWAALAQLQASLLPDLGIDGYSPRPYGQAEQQRLDELSATVPADLQRCIGTSGGPKSLAQMYLDTGMPEAYLPYQMIDLERAVDRDMPEATLVERLFEATARARTELAALQMQDEHTSDALRIYDYEEDADDAAVRVLQAIGLPATSNADALMKLVPAAQRGACEAAIAKGSAPYGRLMDLHNATCWRVQHSRDLARAIAHCAPGQTRPARAVRGASSQNVDPIDPIEQARRTYDSAD